MHIELRSWVYLSTTTSWIAMRNEEWEISATVTFPQNWLTGTKNQFTSIVHYPQEAKEKLDELKQCAKSAVSLWVADFLTDRWVVHSPMHVLWVWLGHRGYWPTNLKSWVRKLDSIASQLRRHGLLLLFREGSRIDGTNVGNELRWIIGAPKVWYLLCSCQNVSQHNRMWQSNNWYGRLGDR